MQRYVKVDLDEDECEAVHTLCDCANVMLDNIGSTLTAQQRAYLRAKLNSVRFKMGAASMLFKRGDAPRLIAPDNIALDLAARARK